MMTRPSTSKLHAAATRVVFGALQCPASEVRVRASPRKAGIQGRELRRLLPWIPACAGMSGTCSCAVKRRSFLDAPHGGLPEASLLGDLAHKRIELSHNHSGPRHACSQAVAG